MSYISFEDVCKDYPAGNTVVHASDHVNFQIEKGEFCVVLGPSGAGKTTVLNLLGGMAGYGLFARMRRAFGRTRWFAALLGGDAPDGCPPGAPGPALTGRF